MLIHRPLAELDDRVAFPDCGVGRPLLETSFEVAVEVPMGDFFAVGNAMQANVNSLPVKVCSRGRGYNCYWQMPFRKEARITLTNESPEEPASSYYHIERGSTSSRRAPRRV